MSVPFETLDNTNKLIISTTSDCFVTCAICNKPLEPPWRLSVSYHKITEKVTFSFVHIHGGCLEKASQYKRMAWGSKIQLLERHKKRFLGECQTPLEIIQRYIEPYQNVFYEHIQQYDFNSMNVNFTPIHSTSSGGLLSFIVQLGENCNLPNHNDLIYQHTMQMSLKRVTIRYVYFKGNSVLKTETLLQQLKPKSNNKFRVYSYIHTSTSTGHIVALISVQEFVNTGGGVKAKWNQMPCIRDQEEDQKEYEEYFLNSFVKVFQGNSVIEKVEIHEILDITRTVHSTYYYYNAQLELDRKKYYFIPITDTVGPILCYEGIITEPVPIFYDNLSNLNTEIHIITQTSDGKSLEKKELQSLQRLY